MSELGYGFPTAPNPGHAAGMADVGSAAQSHRLYNAENRAELKARRPSRFAVVRRLLNRLTRGSR